MIFRRGAVSASCFCPHVGVQTPAFTRYQVIDTSIFEFSMLWVRRPVNLYIYAVPLIHTLLGWEYTNDTSLEPRPVS